MRRVRVLAVDIGTSSVKAAVFDNRRLVTAVARRPVESRIAPPRAEVPVRGLERSLMAAIADLGAAARKADRLAFDVLSPSFIALDRCGDPLTDFITHQDRRSIPQARRLEKIFGRRRHLQLAGNRPFPGGIASTTLLWLVENAPAVVRRAATFGMASTYFLVKLAGARKIDPGNAAFMGFYDGLGMSGWRRELLSPSGVSIGQLPEVRDGAEVAGKLLPAAARRLGLPSGLEVLVGLIDTSAAFLGVGAERGRIINVIGTTDVIALCAGRPKPHSRILTRPLGAGRLWLSVYTIAAGGGAVQWARKAIFPDFSEENFFKLAKRLAGARMASRANFRPYLAGDRMSIEQRDAGFDHLTLETTREDLLAAILSSLAEWNAAGMKLLTRRARPLRDVYVSGGGGWLGELLHGAWPGKWRFHQVQDATLRGLAELAERTV